MPDDFVGRHVETHGDCQARVAWTVDGLAEALGSFKARRLVDLHRVEAWIDSIGTERELPIPYSGRCQAVMSPCYGCSLPDRIGALSGLP